MHQSLFTALENADSIEINDTFVKTFNFDKTVGDDDTALDAGDFDFTLEELKKATFDENNSSWNIEDHNGDRFDIEFYSVKKQTLNGISQTTDTQDKSKINLLSESAAYIEVPSAVKDSVESLLGETEFLFSNSSSLIIDIIELIQVGLDCDSTELFDELVETLAPVAECTPKDLKNQLLSIAYLEIH